VKIAQGCIVLVADYNEVQELREQLYEAKQVVKGIKDAPV
jgi:toxic protein SymE